MSKEGPEESQEIDEILAKDPPISFRSQRYRSIINALYNLKKLNKTHLVFKDKKPQEHVKLYKETSRKFINSQLMIVFEVIIAIVYTVIVAFEMTTDEESNQTIIIAIRMAESLILAIFWFILTMRIIKNFSSHSKSNGKRRKPWILLDLIVTILISLPSSSIPFIASRLNIDYLSLRDRLKFIYIFQSLAILKLFFFIKPMRKLMVKIFIEPFFKLYLLALILLIITVYTIFAIYFFKGYIESDIPDLKYQYRFNTFSSSWTTVLQIMTFDEWGELFQDITRAENKYKTYLFFLSWLWIGGFIIAHLFVGIYVDNFLDLKGRLRKQKIKNEERIEEYRKLLLEDMTLQRNMRNNNDKEASQKENTKTKKITDFKTVNEDVRLIGLKLKSQSMQLSKLIREFDQTKVIFKKKGTRRELDSSLFLYGIKDTMMWNLEKEKEKQYLITLYKISQNLAENNQLRDLLTLVLHEVTNHSDQIE